MGGHGPIKGSDPETPDRDTPRDLHTSRRSVGFSLGRGFSWGQDYPTWAEKTTPRLFVM